MLQLVERVPLGTTVPLVVPQSKLGEGLSPPLVANQEFAKYSPFAPGDEVLRYLYLQFQSDSLEPG